MAEDKSSGALSVGLFARPKPPLAILLGFQLLMLMVSSPLPAVYIIHKHVCAGDDNVFFAELLSLCLFLNGLSTAMQLILGVRLPINVGMSYSYLPPIIAMMSASHWKCADPVDSTAASSGLQLNVSSFYNSTSSSGVISQSYLNSSGNLSIITNTDPPWKSRINYINGALITAALVQFTLGLTGLAGLLMRLIGPLTVVSLVGLLALSLYDSVASALGQHWGVGSLVIVLLLIQNLLMDRIAVPIPSWSRAKGCHLKRYPVFKQFAVLIAIGLGWLVCYILTVTEVLPSNHKSLGFYARTDARIDVLSKTKWFFFPYPGMWGTPTFGVGSFFSILTAVLADMVESIGVYYASARVCGVAKPPHHAINRGVVSESISNLLGGMIGSTCGIGSFSSSIGIMTVTGVGSRIVWLIAGFMLVVCGVIGKIGAALSLVPDPVIGGMTIITLGCLFSVAFTNLQMVNMKIGRNIMILGSSVMLGLAIPSWMNKHPEAIKTGNSSVDQTLTVLLSNAMLVGGVLACLMDNLVPGSKEDRGLGLYLEELGLEGSSSEETNTELYDIPLISDALRRCRPCHYIPCLPSFRHNRKQRPEVPAEEIRMNPSDSNHINEI